MYSKIPKIFAVLSSITIILLLVCNLIFLIPILSPPDPPLSESQQEVQGINFSDMRCLNFEQALEAPNEGDWGYVIQKDHLQNARIQGFNTVRIPIAWAAHTSENSPYTIDESFFARVDEVLGWTDQADLITIIDIHNYKEILEDPDGEREKFLSIWDQISKRYVNYDGDLIYELLNEPNNNIKVYKWNELSRDATEIIRKTDTEKIIAIGPANFNTSSKLNFLDLPDDPNIISTVHIYEPLKFTHQGAHWLEEYENLEGIEWEESFFEELSPKYIFNEIFRWQQDSDVPIYIGEFGAINKADMESRLRWIEFMRTESEIRDIGWCYWDFVGNFNIYDLENEEWDEEMLKALGL